MTKLKGNEKREWEVKTGSQNKTEIYQRARTGWNEVGEVKENKENEACEGNKKGLDVNNKWIDWSESGAAEKWTNTTFKERSVRQSGPTKRIKWASGLHKSKRMWVRSELIERSDEAGLNLLIVHTWSETIGVKKANRECLEVNTEWKDGSNQVNNEHRAMERSERMKWRDRANEAKTRNKWVK